MPWHERGKAGGREAGCEGHGSFCSHRSASRRCMAHQGAQPPGARQRASKEEMGLTQDQCHGWERNADGNEWIPEHVWFALSGTHLPKTPHALSAWNKNMPKGKPETITHLPTCPVLSSDLLVHTQFLCSTTEDPCPLGPPNSEISRLRPPVLCSPEACSTSSATRWMC